MVLSHVKCLGIFKIVNRTGFLYVNDCAFTCLKTAKRDVYQQRVLERGVECFYHFCNVMFPSCFRTHVLASFHYWAWTTITGNKPMHTDMDTGTGGGPKQTG